MTGPTASKAKTSPIKIDKPKSKTETKPGSKGKDPKAGSKTTGVKTTKPPAKTKA
ncbi:hypothetical protein M231_01062 [Tremella mesenterica]|uniref:Uncharacterized protein n=1 Tax=Tremella mesenterica TaxID=5217 RepID=A0A4Q1BTZ2_TREME|nr:hypothetical protein M231_01062 [Tremella mesenterica]